MTTNYNEIFLFDSLKEYKEGDIFKSPLMSSDYRLEVFDGLEIKKVYYKFGIRTLKFDYKEWFNNKTTFKKKYHNSYNKKRTGFNTKF